MHLIATNERKKYHCMSQSVFFFPPSSLTKFAPPLLLDTKSCPSTWLEAQGQEFLSSEQRRKKKETTLSPPHPQKELNMLEEICRAS